MSKDLTLLRKINEDKGQLYEVDIPEETEFLDWDKRLSDQSDEVNKALDVEFKLYRDTEGKEGAYFTKTDPGYRIYKEFVNKYGSPQTASARLKELGIAGNKYFDANSRVGGENDGSYNFVVFDDKNIDIKQTFYQGKRGFIRENETGTGYIIGLLDADLSTFLHEGFGHLFTLELKKAGVKSPVAKKQWDTLADYYGYDENGKKKEKVL